ncbi:MAG: prepilin peptidase [Myxococcales bacterium]|nr:prepilin peptidase [Myxococcales bacterium]
MPADPFDLCGIPWAWALATVALLGALLGSFAGVCIARIPRGRSIVYPGSYCFDCSAPVAWHDNLPIVSYLLLRGRCRSCGVRFSARALFLEVGLAALFAALLWVEFVHGLDVAPELLLARFAVRALFVLVLVVIAFIDLDTRLILDRISYPAIPLFIVAAWLTGLRTLPEALIGAAVGYGVVRLVSDGYYRLTGREGLGYGDGKLLAIVGGLCGWQGVLFTLFGGSVAGSVIGVSAILWARRGKPALASPEPIAPAELTDPAVLPGLTDDTVPLRHVELPFGPFLVAAALAYLFLERVVAIGLLPWLIGGE